MARYTHIDVFTDVDDFLRTLAETEDEVRLVISMFTTVMRDLGDHLPRILRYGYKICEMVIHDTSEDDGDYEVIHRIVEASSLRKIVFRYTEDHDLHHDFLLRLVDRTHLTRIFIEISFGFSMRGWSIVRRMLSRGLRQCAIYCINISWENFKMLFRYDLVYLRLYFESFDIRSQNILHGYIRLSQVKHLFINSTLDQNTTHPFFEVMDKFESFGPPRIPSDQCLQLMDEHLPNTNITCLRLRFARWLGDGSEIEHLCHIIDRHIVLQELDIAIDEYLDTEHLLTTIRRHPRLKRVALHAGPRQIHVQELSEILSPTTRTLFYLLALSKYRRWVLRPDIIYLLARYM